MIKVGLGLGWRCHQSRIRTASVWPRHLIRCAVARRRRTFWTILPAAAGFSATSSICRQDRRHRHDRLEPLAPWGHHRRHWCGRLHPAAFFFAGCALPDYLYEAAEIDPPAHCRILDITCPPCCPYDAGRAVTGHREFHDVDMWSSSHGRNRIGDGAGTINSSAKRSRVRNGYSRRSRDVRHHLRLGNIYVKVSSGEI